jgi:hypothetical protein
MPKVKVEEMTLKVISAETVEGTGQKQKLTINKTIGGGGLDCTGHAYNKGSKVWYPNYCTAFKLSKKEVEKILTPQLTDDPADLRVFNKDGVLVGTGDDFDIDVETNVPHVEYYDEDSGEEYNIYTTIAKTAKNQKARAEIEVFNGERGYGNAEATFTFYIEDLEKLKKEVEKI